MIDKNACIVDAPLVAVHDNGRRTPLSLTWLNDEEIDASFTVVSSRKSRKEKKSDCF